MEATVDRQSWKGLEELRGVLFGVLSRHCRDESEVHDLIHETYIRAARYRGNLTETGRLRSWMTRIALNVLSDWKRREQRLVSNVGEEGDLEAVAFDPPEEEPEARFRIGRWELERSAALGLVNAARAGLRADDRQVLDSFYGGDQSCRATAAECDIPAHLVKVRLFRARERLRRSIRQRLALGEARRAGARAGRPAELVTGVPVSCSEPRRAAAHPRGASA